MSLARPTTPLSRGLRSAVGSASSSRAASYQRPATPWPSKNHLKPKMSLPNPLPALFPQKVVLSDGSTFTSYSTAPTPAILRMTRDVTNNPLWSPSTERRGLGDGVEEGRVGRFRRRFEGAGQKDAQKSAFGSADLQWMSEGALSEKAPAQKNAAKKGGKK
ncbi:hypothetical protein CcaverHIS002_0203620 [Cutaneotrichosporon cavernicola]|uniref:50S ribosomal protein L36 n=1 Tax=Cutaneotrichosporon cavernicola TaxID=279322 RepID=A0AA48IIE1_9TREE|nr:uncharacterized protein CcaverHIS019_0203600 [Cutaneotrichosporon cavernicola]BEI81202.1 hypothetical protein CcaverHIS002_0203620 [Cutaneotrichosporon cavernicola]BEI88998.1 hypothetical protein CcaverHIS019_0203600 [Cutaneotrichosporon cavernicola]BEI96774.1 hypothetical protein CcaverHIS631_0203630 [Cutaneotrichosporon cavernicola]BEJ04546.1 hypothetical protein CcaverHIS641_0203630 [Cutaneotrichosporon cavernicola]